jgi:hypothetical protein
MFGGSQKYWIPVLLAESVAVVVSILLAFAIDAWWENREERAEELRAMQGLKSEFELNLALIDTELVYRNAVIFSLQQLFDSAAGKTTLAPETLDKLIGDVTWWGAADYSTGVLDSLIQGGALSIITNKELRYLLASLPEIYRGAIRNELQDYDTSRNVIYPFLYENASFSQIANTMEAGKPGLGIGQTPAIYPASESRDHTALLGNSEFVGILVREHWDHLDAITGYEQLQVAMERSIQLIDEALGS